jgi:hypothetical protein
MIKDKITPNLKNRFLEEIKKSGESRKERGFLLCLDKKGDIYPTETCEGEECGIKLYYKTEDKDVCPEKTQGEFHTHPVVTMLRESSKEVLGYTPSDDIIKTLLTGILKEREKEEGIDITLQMPSYTDVLGAVLGKCAGVSNGTSCVGTDIEDDKVECWTMRDIAQENRMDICKKAMDELSEVRKLREKKFIPTRKWVKPIFDREIINIKYWHDRWIRTK